MNPLSVEIPLPGKPFPSGFRLPVSGLENCPAVHVPVQVNAAKWRKIM
jgi:hypothetical protein